jgi:hypothetical protein
MRIEKRRRKSLAATLAVATLAGALGTGAIAVSANAEELKPTETTQTQETTSETRTARIDGKDVDLALENGVWTYTGTVKELPDQISVTDQDGNQIQAQKGNQKSGRNEAGFGVILTAASCDYTAKDIKITLDHTTTKGETVTLKDGGKFKRLAGTWAATGSTSLDEHDNPAMSAVELTDGTKATIHWQAPTTSENDGAVYVIRRGSASGTIKTGQPFTVGVIASRAQDKTFKSLSVLETGADGKTSTLEVPGFDPATTSYQIELDSAKVTDSFALAPETGVDADKGETTSTLGTDGARVMTTSVNGKDYTVTITFKTSDISPDSTAKLTGIYVNKSGQASKGDLVEGWNPNRLDYVVSIGEKDPSPYILAEGGSDVTISAGDVKQTATTSMQAWKVTSTVDGAKRTYTVTVARGHDWKSADEAFEPKDAQAQAPTQAPATESDTDLESAGYVDESGAYVPQQRTSFQIPEGAGFSYKAKTGQTVSVSSKKTSGMTYQVTADVLAADGTSFARHTYQITYITTTTHTAALTGLSVDGKPVEGFDPSRTDYTVTVADLETWTVVPSYDKTSGASVVTHKDGDTATVTITSADGLVTRVYTIHAVLAASARGADGTLAHTGAAVAAPALAGLGLLGAGLATLFARKKKATTKGGEAIDKE